MIDRIRSEHTLILARLGEVWLKGKNRRLFLGRLQRNLQTALSAELRGCQVQATGLTAALRCHSAAIQPKAQTPHGDVQLLLRLLMRRKGQRRRSQNPDDGDHHQQFHQDDPYQ